MERDSESGNNVRERISPSITPRRVTLLQDVD